MIRPSSVPARLVAGVLLLAALAGCSADDSRPTPLSGASSSTGSSSASASVDPRSPLVVVAAAVGSRSRTQVVALHAMGTSTTTDGAIPHGELPRQGAVIEAALQQQVRDAVRLPPPTGSAAGRLVAALRTYAGLAGTLAAWNPTDGRLPSSWFAHLRTTDADWTAAMRALSTTVGRDLLADLPTLTAPGA